jgi:hypothetical protein
MASEAKSYRFVDTGTGPEFFISGLHEVQVMGSVARFVFYVLKPGPNGEQFADSPLTFIMPVDAIGPEIALILSRLPDLNIPAKQLALN